MFDIITESDTVSWNTMIFVLVRSECFQEAVKVVNNTVGVSDCS